MSPAPSDHRDALTALERLVNRHHVLSMEEARAAARLITGDPEVQFPLPRPERPPQAPPQAEGSNGGGGKPEQEEPRGGGSAPPSPPSDAA